MDRKKRLLEKVKALREGAMFQKGAILPNSDGTIGNPLKEYCWVNSKDDRRVTYEAMGWQVCKDPKVKTRWQKEDGTHVRADLVLYEIDKELFEAMMAYNQLRGIEAVEGNPEAFMAALDRDKVPAYKTELSLK
jgi:hypothetical protein